MGDIMNKRKNNGVNNYPKKKDLIDSKDLERNVLNEISKELMITNKANKNKKK